MDALLEKAASGDDRAWRKVLTKYRALVGKAVGGIIRNREDREEVIQDVFVLAFRHADRYDPRLGQFSTWLTHLARNAALSRMYKDRRRTKAAGMVSLELVPEQMVDRMTPDRKLQRDRINAAVGAAIDTLPRNQRDVVDLICFGGVSREDAAVMLGCSQQDVAYAVRWARTALRQQLAGYA